MANTIPQTIANAEVYLEGERIPGLVTIELGNLQPVTVEMKGNGFGGQTDVPVRGHFQNMSMKLTWRVAAAEVRKLMVQKYHHIEAWAAVQTVDSATGEFIDVQQKVVFRACPTNTNLGNFTMGELQNVEIDFNYTYMKWFSGNEEICEIDQPNMIHKVYGQDMLAGIRGASGL